VKHRRLVGLSLALAGVLLTSQMLGANAADVRRVGVVVASLDAAGFPGKVTLNEFTRTYTGNGSKDAAKASTLTLENGIVNTANGHRALPIVVRTHFFLDGAEVTPAAIAGKSGAFKVQWALTNRTQRTEELTYTDSNTGEQKTITAATVLPFTVELAGLHLPDASFDDLTTNGLAGRSADNTATDVSWTAVLAPPVFPGTATFSIEGRTSAFKLPGGDIVATPGLSGALPTAAKDAAEKGGATTGTLRGYVNKFGDGFGQLSSGLGQIKGGVDQIFAGIDGQLKPGLKAPNFDRALFDEDSSLANNQPGLVQGLEVLADGLGKLVDAAGQIRAGLKSGDAAKPGVLEGLEQVTAGLGQGNEFDGSGNPLTIRASLNAIRVGLSSGDALSPGIVEGLNQIVAAIGNGNEVDRSGNPLTLRASLNAIRGGLSSGNPADPKIIEGLEQIFASIGSGTEFSGTTPLTVAAGLAAIRGGLKSGDINNPKIIEGLQKIYGSIGNGTEFSGTTPLSLAASLVGVRAALSSGDANNPAILEGLQQIYNGIGAGTEFDGGGNPLTVRASLNAIRAALSSGNPADPKIIEAVQLVVAGMSTLSSSLNLFDTSFVTQVNTTLGGLGLPLIDPLSIPVVQGVVHAGVTQAQTALAQMQAALSSGNPADPKVLEGLQRIYASIGNGSEFSGSTPLTVAASLVAMRAGLSSGDANNPKIIEGVQKIYAAIGTGAEFSGTTPLTIRAGLNAIRAGLQSGNPATPAVLEGLQQIYDSVGNGTEFSGTTPLTIRAGLNAIRAGLKSGNPNDPKIVEGLQKIWGAIGDGSEFNGTTPLSIAAGLLAIQQGAATIAGGAQLAHDGLGTGAAGEFAADGSPLTVQASLVALGSGVTKLGDGIKQIVTGLGDIGPDGKPVKAVTKRTTRFGNTLEDPASLLWALSSSQSVVTTKFIVGVNQILDALGDPKVSSSTILYGLKQLSDGIGQAGDGATSGASGAEQLAHVLSRTVASQDVAAALHQAGNARLDAFTGFNDGGTGRQQSVFVLRLGGVG